MDLQDSELEALKERLKTLKASLKQQNAINSRLESSALSVWIRQIKDADRQDKEAFFSSYLAQKTSKTNHQLDKRFQLNSDIGKWKCRQYRTRLLDVDDKGDTVTEWKSAFHLPNIPNTILAFKFEHLVTASRIQNLKINFTDISKGDDEKILIDEDEVQPLIDFCENFATFQPAFDCFEQYLSMSSKRMEAIRDPSDNMKVVSPSEIVFLNEKGAELATLHWQVKFMPGQMKFVESYFVTFSEKGILAIIIKILMFCSNYCVSF